MPRIRHGSACMFDLRPDADHRKIMERLALGIGPAFDQIPIWTSVPVPQDDLGKNYKAQYGPESHVALHYRQWSREPGMKHLFADLKAANFPIVDFRDSPLHPPEPEGDLPATWFQCQVNFFPDGLILVFSAFHVAIDLVTEALSVARWSEGMSATYEDEVPEYSELPPECHDRQILTGGDDQASMDALGVHKFDLMDMLNNQDTSENAIALFRFSPLDQNKLKKAASSSDAKKWVSTADAMEAFTWRHVVRARDRAAGTRAEGNSRILSGVNMRGRLRQEVAPEYIGACTAMAPLDTSRELLHSKAPGSLNKLAHHIRTSLSAWDGSSWVNGMIGTWPKLDLQEMVWYKDAGELLFTDHSAFPCYVVNWGPDLGQMICWREPYINRPPPRGEVMILPKRLDGASEFMVTLEPEAMKHLLADRDFKEYAELLVICNDGGLDLTSTGASKL